MGERGAAVGEGPLYRHGYCADGERDSGQFPEIPPFQCEETRRYKGRDRRDPHTCCFLRRLAEGMGRVPYGERGMAVICVSVQKGKLKKWNIQR